MKKISIIQMVSTDQVVENLKSTEKLLKQSREQGADCVLLPENFACMVNQESDSIRIAENFKDGPIQSFVQEQARALDLWIIAGTIPLKSDHPNKATASSLVFDNKGQLRARYDKVHLFDVEVSKEEVYQESDSVVPGNRYQVLQTPIGKIGLSVCYDLRFPEQYRDMMQQGAELFVIPSAFTKITGHAHWHILVRARAIENLAFVAAANQGGLHINQRQTYGHSMLVNPWGEILSELQEGEGVITHEIDLDQLADRRRHFPCLRLYGL